MVPTECRRRTTRSRGYCRSRTPGTSEHSTTCRRRGTASFLSIILHINNRSSNRRRSWRQRSSETPYLFHISSIYSTRTTGQRNVMTMMTMADEVARPRFRDTKRRLISWLTADVSDLVRDHGPNDSISFFFSLASSYFVSLVDSIVIRSCSYTLLFIRVDRAVSKQRQKVRKSARCHRGEPSTAVRNTASYSR